MKLDRTQILKKHWKIIANKYFLQTIYWSIMVAALLIFAIAIGFNKKLFQTLLTWDFFNNKWNFTSYLSTDNDVLAFQTYLSMAILAAVLALIGLIIIQIKITFKKYVEMKYQVVSNIENNYFIFKNLLFVNIAKNITFIFCFTNAITCCLVLLYLIICFISDSIINRTLRDIKGQIKKKLTVTKENQSLIFILTIEAFYFLLKNFLKIDKINIDFDSYLKYFIPASSLALIMAVFIQSLIKNDVKKVLSNMNNVNTQVDNFRIFYQLEQDNSLSSYQFIAFLPSFVKKKLKNHNLNKSEALELVKKIYGLIILIDEKNIKKNEYNYLMYHIFYEIKDEKGIEKMDQTFKKLPCYN